MSECSRLVLTELSGPILDLPSGLHSYRVEELAYTRSGDKGDTANIGESTRSLGTELLSGAMILLGVAPDFAPSCP